QIQLSLFSALAVRLSRVYGSVMLILAISWAVKVQEYPVPTRSLSEFVRRAHVAQIPGWAVLGSLSIIWIGLAFLYATSLSAPSPWGELGIRHRLRRAPLWQRLVRPYAMQTPRSHLRRPPERAHRVE